MPAHRERWQLAALGLGDLTIAFAALELGLLGRFGLDGAHGLGILRRGLQLFVQGAPAGLLALAIPPLFYYLAELYELRYDYRRLGLQLRLFAANAVAFLVLFALYYAIPQWRLFRGALAIHIVAVTVGIPAFRVAFSTYTSKLRPSERMLLLGANVYTRRMIAAVKANPGGGVVVVGCLQHPHDELPEDLGCDIVGATADIERICAEMQVNAVVSTLRQLTPEFGARLLALKLGGVRVHDFAARYREFARKLPVGYLTDAAFAFDERMNHLGSVIALRLLRIFDIVVSICMFVIAAPIMLFVAGLILLNMGRPILFVQARVGLNEAEFDLYKFRTMRTDAEAKTGPVWSAGSTDPRVTALGRFLRRTRLDELPQLWNVLRGDMSFIGPRPERRFFVDQLKASIPYYSMRFLVKPGLTGWAQVNYRYGASEEDALEKLEYELYYLQDMSLGMNMLILLKTVQTVLFRPGS